jgi:hypothetical protein
MRTARLSWAGDQPGETPWVPVNTAYKKATRLVVGFCVGCVAGALAFIVLSGWSWSIPIALSAAAIAIAIKPQLVVGRSVL